MQYFTNARLLKTILLPVICEAMGSLHITLLLHSAVDDKHMRRVFVIRADAVVSDPHV